MENITQLIYKLFIAASVYSAAIDLAILLLTE